MNDTAQERRHRLIGIALMCGAVLCFACLDSVAKFLSPHMPTMQIVWARNISGFLLTFVLMNPLTRPRILRTARPGLQIVRSLLLLATTLFNFLAVRYLQLDEALSIMFATPFLVAVLAGPMLGEWLGWRRWIAICVGFAGVLLVTRPGFGGMHPAALFSLAGALCYAFYGIITRVVSRSDSNETTLFYSNLVCALVVLPVLPFVWTPPEDALIVVLMVVMGAFGSLGHYLLIIGHRLAPASVLSPFIYTQMIWVIALGYLVFGDIPTEWTLTGAGIVIASGLYLIQRERKRRVAPPSNDIL